MTRPRATPASPTAGLDGLDDLAAAAAAGDPRSGRELQRRLEPRLRRLAEAVTGEQTAADRVARDALAALPAQRGRGPVSSWAVSEVLRRAGEAPGAPGAPGAGLDDPADRLVLLLVDGDGRSEAEASRLSGLAPDEVAERRRRARAVAGLGPVPAPPRCLGWHLVSRLGRLTGAEETAARGHLELCSSCTAALGEARRSAVVVLSVLVPATVAATGVAGLVATLAQHAHRVRPEAVGAAAAAVLLAGTVAVASAPAPAPAPQPAAATSAAAPAPAAAPAVAGPTAVPPAAPAAPVLPAPDVAPRVDAVAVARTGDPSPLPGRPPSPGPAATTLPAPATRAAASGGPHLPTALAAPAPAAGRVPAASAPAAPAPAPPSSPAAGPTPVTTDAAGPAPRATAPDPGRALVAAADPAYASEAATVTSLLTATHRDTVSSDGAVLTRAALLAAVAAATVPSATRPVVVLTASPSLSLLGPASVDVADGSVSVADLAAAVRPGSDAVVVLDLTATPTLDLTAYAQPFAAAGRVVVASSSPSVGTVDSVLGTGHTTFGGVFWTALGAADISVQEAYAAAAGDVLGPLARAVLLDGAGHPVHLR